VKPFVARELLARIKAILRRTRALPPNLQITERPRIRSLSSVRAVSISTGISCCGLARSWRQSVKPDDYLVKPFVARELLARIKAILRRTRALPPNLQKNGLDARQQFAGHKGLHQIVVRPHLEAEDPVAVVVIKLT
jgi:DNA-binding response OmpR family regulator